MSYLIDLTRCESEGEIRRCLADYGIHGVNPWLARTVEIHDTYAIVVCAIPDDRGRPTPRRQITRHERDGVGI